MEELAVQRIRALLAEASDAHSHFEQNQLGGVRDQEWPAWYAKYLIDHGIMRFIRYEIGEDELAELLRVCDVAYQRDQPQDQWPDYYALLILNAR